MQASKLKWFDPIPIVWHSSTVPVQLPHSSNSRSNVLISLICCQYRLKAYICWIVIHRYWWLCSLTCTASWLCVSHATCQTDSNEECCKTENVCEDNLCNRVVKYLYSRFSAIRSPQKRIRWISSVNYSQFYLKKFSICKRKFPSTVRRWNPCGSRIG